VIILLSRDRCLFRLNPPITLHRVQIRWLPITKVTIGVIPPNHHMKVAHMDVMSCKRGVAVVEVIIKDMHQANFRISRMDTVVGFQGRTNHAILLPIWAGHLLTINSTQIHLGIHLAAHI
jgi:hypothetical protein